jgi:hypothetical protein
MKDGAKQAGARVGAASRAGDGRRAADAPRVDNGRADDALWVDIDRRLAMLLDFLSAVRIDLTMGETPRGLVSASERLKLTASQLDAAIRTTRDILNKVDTRSGAEAAIFNGKGGTPASRRRVTYSKVKPHAKPGDY